MGESFGEQLPIPKPESDRDVSDRLYQERKELVEGSFTDGQITGVALAAIAEHRGAEDEHAIENAMPHFAETSGWENLSEVYFREGGRPELLESALNGSAVVNLGSGGGEEGVFMSSEMVRLMGVSGVEMVDPFFDARAVGERIEKEVQQSPGSQGRLRFTQDDGLHYLLEQQEVAGNILISTVNHSNMSAAMPEVAPDGTGMAISWLRRVAQESYRVLPDGGVLMCVDSDEIADEAAEIFGPENTHRFGPVRVFVKPAK